MRDTGHRHRGSGRFRRAAVLALSLAALLTACSPQLTAPSSQDIPIEREEKFVAEDGWATILKSVDQSRTITRFGLQGTLETKERNQYHRSQVYGHIIAPDQIEMSQNVDGRSYYIYQDAKSAYYREEGVWRPIDRIALPDTWGSLERLRHIQPPKEVYRFKDMSILTPNDTEVYQFEADAIRLAGMPGTQGKTLPSQYTVYIDKKTRYIRQIDIQSTGAVDDVGTVWSNATLRFFDIDKPDLKIEMPPGLKQQLKIDGKKDR